MYVDFTLERFISYVIYAATQSRVRIGRNAAGVVDALIIWDEGADPETVYMECLIGRASEFLRLRKDLPTRYKFVAKHRRGVYAKYPLLSNQH